MQPAIERGIDVAEAMELLRSVGWRWGEPHARRTLGYAGDGAFCARDAAGAPVAMVTCVVWGELAWIGGMIVTEPARGRGLGRVLLRRAIEHARERGATTIGLDATDMGKPLYLSEGFVEFGTSALYERPLPAPSLPPPSLPSGDFAIYPVSPAEVMELMAYDKPRFGANRARLLSDLMSDQPHRAFVAVHRRTGAFSGHAFAIDDRVGPIVADAPEAAAWLLHALERSGAAPRAFVPDWTPGARALFEAAGYERRNHTTRMFLGPPLGEPTRTYAISAWSLG